MKSLNYLWLHLNLSYKWFTVLGTFINAAKFFKQMAFCPASINWDLDRIIHSSISQEKSESYLSSFKDQNDGIDHLLKVVAGGTMPYPPGTHINKMSILKIDWLPMIETLSTGSYTGLISA